MEFIASTAKSGRRSSVVKPNLRKINNAVLAIAGHDFFALLANGADAPGACRMQVSRHDIIGSYVHYLRTRPEEVQALLGLGEGYGCQAK